jgi:hypothetical protein
VLPLYRKSSEIFQDCQSPLRAEAHPQDEYRPQRLSISRENKPRRIEANRKTKVLLGSALAASITVGLAAAIPTIGAWYNVILSPAESVAGLREADGVAAGGFAKSTGL